ncbi:MAG TPA: hypothetical protein VFU22_31980 [Roseiflexaceae bacterium]|nr:hypothetical protein [Roseiflexaceae bacterium]
MIARNLFDRPIAAEGPRPLPYCAYQKAADVAQHGIQPLPDRVRIERNGPRMEELKAALPARLFPN